MPPSEKKIKKRIMKAKAKAKAKPKKQKQRQTQTQKVIQTVKITGASGSARQQNPVMPIQIHQPVAPIYHPSPHQHPNLPPIRPNPVTNTISNPIQRTVSNPVPSTNLIRPNPVVRQVSSLPQKQTLPPHNIPDPVYVVNREISKETTPSKSKPNPIAPENLQKLFKENKKNQNEYAIFATSDRYKHLVNDTKELKAPETKSAWNVKPFARLNNDTDNTLFPDDELTRHY